MAITIFGTLWQCALYGQRFALYDVLKLFFFSEKGIAVCQALLEFNLHNPNFSGRGDYDFDDKVKEQF